MAARGNCIRYRSPAAPLLHLSNAQLLADLELLEAPSPGSAFYARGDAKVVEDLDPSVRFHSSCSSVASRSNMQSQGGTVGLFWVTVSQLPCSSILKVTLQPACAAALSRSKHVHSDISCVGEDNSGVRRIETQCRKPRWGMNRPQNSHMPLPLLKIRWKGPLPPPLPQRQPRTCQRPSAQLL